MKIETSLDWQAVYKVLRHRLHNLPYNPDLYKMATNIDKMIESLSKNEVEARRIHKPEYTKQEVDRINKAIDHLEKLMLIAKLMA
jgi:hypothetical protein